MCGDMIWILKPNFIQSPALQNIHHHPNERSHFETLRDWLKPVLVENDVEHLRLKRAENTREWLLDEIRQWYLQSDKQFLWLLGPAGSGKSVVAASLVADLQAKKHSVGA